MSEPTMSETKSRFWDEIVFTPTSMIATPPGWRAFYVYKEGGVVKGTECPIAVWALGELVITPYTDGKPNPNDPPTRRMVIEGMIAGECGDLERADLAENFIAYLAPGEAPPETLEGLL